MNRDAVEAVVAKMRRAWNDGDFEALGACYAEDALSYDVEFEEPAKGRAAIVEGAQMYLAGFPDSKFTVEGVMVDGNRACEQWSADGHHTGEILGYEPTGNYTFARGCSVIEIGPDGLIVKETLYWDSAGMYRQMGALPPLTQPKHTTT